MNKCQQKQLQRLAPKGWEKAKELPDGQIVVRRLKLELVTSGSRFEYKKITLNGSAERL